MLFQVHAHETCPGAHPELTPGFREWWQGMKNNSGIKVVSGYVSPMDHTFHITVEADNYQTLARALGPLNTIGTGHTSPVITLDEAFPMAESGAFQMPQSSTR